MATKTKTVSNVAEAVDAIGRLPNQNQQYKSCAAMLEAAAPDTAGRIGTQVRQIMRDAGKKVGRGKRYDTITPRVLVSTHKQNQAAKASSKAAKKAPKPKVAKKEKVATPA